MVKQDTSEGEADDPAECHSYMSIKAKGRCRRKERQGSCMSRKDLLIGCPGRRSHRPCKFVMSRILTHKCVTLNTAYK